MAHYRVEALRKRLMFMSKTDDDGAMVLPSSSSLPTKSVVVQLGMMDPNNAKDRKCISQSTSVESEVEDSMMRDTWDARKLTNKHRREVFDTQFAVNTT